MCSTKAGVAMTFSGVRMTPAMTAELKLYAKQLDTTFSELVRDACRAYMASKGIEVAA